MADLKMIVILFPPFNNIRVDLTKKLIDMADDIESYLNELPEEESARGRDLFKKFYHQTLVIEHEDKVPKEEIDSSVASIHFNVIKKRLEHM